MINVGATCGTCKFINKSNPSACHRCMNENGRPGYEPTDNVQMVYGEDSFGRATRRPVKKEGGAA